MYACIIPTATLHPVSHALLMAFLEGPMPVEEFLRLFSLPNSVYVGLAECLVRILT